MQVKGQQLQLASSVCTSARDQLKAASAALRCLPSLLARLFKNLLHLNLFDHRLLCIDARFNG